MNYSRKDYIDFLEAELKAQNDAFLTLLATSAAELLEQKGELFLGKFLALKDGNMMLKMSSSRLLPRKGMRLNCLVLPAELRDWHNWHNNTYGDLINLQECHSEAECIWYGRCADDARFVLVGFRGIDCDFAKRIANVRGIILTLGPNIPPYECLQNLQRMCSDSAANSVLDGEFAPHHCTPIPLDDKIAPADFLHQQLMLTDTLALQGPPGTGKTTLVAELCARLLAEGKSVLVTALTNRALIEVTTKSHLQEVLQQGKVSKVNLTYDEVHDVPQLEKAKDVCALPGRLLLSTHFIASAAAANGLTRKFDYAIMDEASQAILPMFASMQRLADKSLWIGDIRQLPPVVQMNSDKARLRGWQPMVDGFRTLCEQTPMPDYQLSTTYRLGERAARYTSLFYGDHLRSMQTVKTLPFSGDKVSSNLNDGPVLITTDMPLGQKAPQWAINICMTLLRQIMTANPKSKVAVLSCFRNTAMQLLRAAGNEGILDSDIIIDTVARVQGLTCDFTIFIIPNTSMWHSLEPRLFNVATSRAIKGTIIIADKAVVSMAKDSNVRTYMQKLEQEACLYLPAKEIANTLLNFKNNLYADTKRN